MAATAQLLADLAEDLAAAGLRVGALTGRGSYAAAGAERLAARERWGDVEIRRVRCTSFGRTGTAGRLADYLTFLLAAGLHLALARRPADVVVCLSTPPMVALLGRLAQLRGTRFVYKVEDLYPDVAVALGTLRRRSLVTAALRRLSRALLGRADLCVALDREMAGRLRELGAGHVEVIANWADGRAVYPDPEAGLSFRRQIGLGDSLTVLYSGNHGLAHRFDAVLGAARRLRRRDLRFLFVGDGPRRAEVRRAAEELPSVRLLPYQPRRELRRLYNAADLHLITLRDEVSGLLVPSKYAAALAAGKPVLLVGADQSGLGREIRRESVGWSCGHDADEVVAILEQAAADSARTVELGRRGRDLFDRRYERTIATARWSKLLLELAG